MIRRKWLLAGLLALPLAVGGGLAIAASQIDSFTCPFTGKVISWGNCCPLSGCSQETQQPSYSCPVTSEEAPCESCCQQKE
jgi:hypothetical protein